jgi:hypothetical protein
MSGNEPSLFQKHYSKSAIDILLVPDIECLSQNTRFRADTCNICRGGGNTHATLSCPRCIYVAHNTGHCLIQKRLGKRGNSAMSEAKKASEFALFYWVDYFLILNVKFGPYKIYVNLFRKICRQNL